MTSFTFDTHPIEDYEGMTAEELVAYNTSLSNLRVAVQGEQRLINDILSRKTAEREARLKFEALSDAERVALHQIVQADYARAGGKIPPKGGA